MNSTLLNEKYETYIHGMLFLCEGVKNEIMEFKFMMLNYSSSFHTYACINNNVRRFEYPRNLLLGIDIFSSP